jgi:hypothetical protein
LNTVSRVDKNETQFFGRFQNRLIFMNGRCITGTFAPHITINRDPICIYLSTPPQQIEMFPVREQQTGEG